MSLLEAVQHRVEAHCVACSLHLLLKSSLLSPKLLLLAHLAGKNRLDLRGLSLILEGVWVFSWIFNPGHYSHEDFLLVLVVDLVLAANTRKKKQTPTKTRKKPQKRPKRTKQLKTKTKRLLVVLLLSSFFPSRVAISRTPG